MSSNTVRAKVLCTNITVAEVGGHSTLYFSAVYSGDPDSENKSFSDATPSLNVSMTIAPNKPAAQLFEQGQEYYLDFTRVAAVVDPRQTSIVDSRLQVRSVVVYGPQGCGKTTNAVAIAQHLNLETVVDGWDGLTGFPTFGALVLTDLPRSQLVNMLKGRRHRVQIVGFDEVTRSSGLRSAAALASIDDPGESNVRDISDAARNTGGRFADNHGWPKDGRKLHELPEDAARREQILSDQHAGRNDPDPEAHFGAATLDAEAHFGAATLDAEAHFGAATLDAGNADCSSSDSGGSSGD